MSTVVSGWVFLLVLLTAGYPGVLAADPRNAIFKIRAAACDDSVDDKRLTGFVLKGREGILTALHGVVGCKIITAQSAGEDGIVIQGLSIAGADVERDVAQLGGDGLEQLQAIGLAAAQESDPPSSLKAWGFPRNVLSPLDTTVAIRSVQYTSWYQMTDQARQELRSRKSPRADVRMLSVEGSITQGHSGAPIINASEQVVGIANGGLAGGTIGIALAAPVWDLAIKPRSTVESELARIATMDAGILFSDVDKASPAATFAEEGIEFSEAEFIRKIKAGDTRTARRFLEAGINPNTLDENGKSAIVLAARKGDPELIVALIDKGADLGRSSRNQMDVDGWAALSEIILGMNEALPDLDFGLGKAPRITSTIFSDLDVGPSDAADFVMARQLIAATTGSTDSIGRMVSSALRVLPGYFESAKVVILKLERDGIKSVTGIRAMDAAILINDFESANAIIQLRKKSPTIRDLSETLFTATICDGQFESANTVGSLDMLRFLIDSGLDVNVTLTSDRMAPVSLILHKCNWSGFLVDGMLDDTLFSLLSRVPENTNGRLHPSATLEKLRGPRSSQH